MSSVKWVITSFRSAAIRSAISSWSGRWLAGDVLDPFPDGLPRNSHARARIGFHGRDTRAGGHPSDFPIGEQACPRTSFARNDGKPRVTSPRGDSCVSLQPGSPESSIRAHASLDFRAAARASCLSHPYRP